MFIQIAIIAIFKSYPTVGDVALYMAFFPVWNHLYRCEYPHLAPSGTGLCHLALDENSWWLGMDRHFLDICCASSDMKHNICSSVLHTNGNNKNNQHLLSAGCVPGCCGSKNVTCISSFYLYTRL